MRFTLAAPVDNPSRPKGIGFTALLLCGFAVTSLVSGLFELSGGTLAGFFSTRYLPQFFSGSVLLAAELFTIWSYWKGRDWARVLILIGSFWIAAREVSTIIDDGGSPIRLMSRPILFLEFALAVFLLCWLNTRPRRAWFKNVSLTAADLINGLLTGRLCTAVENDPAKPNQGWQLAFEHDAKLTLNCPWRIVLDDNLAFASNFADDPAGKAGPEISIGQGHPQQLLQNLRVKAVRITPRTSDLFIAFEMGLELQTWSTDSHAQQWKFSDPLLTVIADSEGLNSQAAARISTEDSTAND